MRVALRKQVGTGLVPDHLGLAYDMWAPIPPEGNGRLPDAERPEWLRRLQAIRVADDYAGAYQEWLLSFADDPAAHLLEVTARSRVLVGHGNPSPTEVGLTVHHTWGVPVLPGSALKGLLAHWVDENLGPEEAGQDPWRSEHPKPKRAAFQGPVWSESGSRIQYGPGRLYRALFGSPAADGDPAESTPERGEAQGAVVFHDAWYVPGSASDCPYAEDVLTVHHKTYYDQQGRGAWPNDYEGPIPVAFLTVRPGARFAVALSGDAAWCRVAAELLPKALAEWGIGGKTAAGYGVMRGDVAAIDLNELRANRERAAAEEAAARERAAAAQDRAEAQAAAANDPTCGELDAWLAREGKRLTNKERLAALVAEWKPRLDALPLALRGVAAKHVLSEFPKQKRKDVRQQLGFD